MSRYERREYRYNQLDRMAHSAVYDFLHLKGRHSRYEYDGLGRRTLWGEQGKNATRAVYEGLSLNILLEEEVKENKFTLGSVALANVKQYFYNNDEVLGIARSDGISTQVRYFAKDSLGSVRAELGNLTALSRYNYDIFGTSYTGGDSSIDRGYTGKT